MAARHQHSEDTTRLDSSTQLIAQMSLAILLPVAARAASVGAVGDDTKDIRAELTRYYADMKCQGGRLSPEYATHFWPAGTLTTVWQPQY